MSNSEQKGQSEEKQRKELSDGRALEVGSENQSDQGFMRYRVRCLVGS